MEFKNKGLKIQEKSKIQVIQQMILHVTLTWQI